MNRLVAAGVPTSAIEVNLDAASSGGAPPFPEIDSAEISLNLDSPSPTQVEAILAAIERAIEGNDKLFLENNFVRYTSASCGALEQEAYEAAIADAHDRANRIAAAAGVTPAGTPSIAVGNLNGSYELDSCNSESDEFRGEAVGANPSATVEVRRSLTVTYPIR